MAWLNCRQDIPSKWSVKVYFWQKFRKSHTWKVCKINHWTESPEQTPRSDATEHGIWSGCALFATLPAVFQAHQRILKWIYSNLSQRTTKLTIILMQPVKTQISLCICTVWSESLLIACAFYSLQAIQRGIKENLWPTGWMYRLIWVFADYNGYIVGFAVHWLI